MVVSQQKRVQTFEAILWFFQNKAQEIAKTPKIADILSKIQNNLGNISEINQLSSYMKEKDVKQSANATPQRLSLIKNAIIVSQKVAAHATYTRNTQLLTESNYTERQLAGFADNSLVQIILVIVQRAEEHIDSLRQYRLTDEMVAELKNAVQDFSNATGFESSSEEQAPLISSSRSSLRYIRECDAFLLELDSLMQDISLQNIPTYQEYIAFRFSSIHTTEELHFRVGVFDVDSGARISGAMVTVSRMIDHRATTYMRETKPIRNLLFKGIQRGTWTISVADPRYQSAQCDVLMDNPLKSVVIFALKKVQS